MNRNVAPDGLAPFDELPIDKHKQRILDHISKNRITIIQGETGCGKTSRIPQMIYQAETSASRRCMMFISQPRRIAARSLAYRLGDGENGEVYGYRMGHGEKSETDATRIWFVTAGYLVQYITGNSRGFRNHSHLIIDEVHERSIESDLLCMLAKKLLIEHRHLRLIVMSATIQSRLYANYFQIPESDTLSVGARRFPVDINYLDEFEKVKLPKHVKSKVSQLMDCCSRSCQNISGSVPASVSKLQSDLALTIIEKYGQSKTRRPNSAVLIFVSGMSDILELSDIIDRLNVAVGRAMYKAYPIHSELPLEVQNRIFDKAQPDELKIIIATNSAESSLTLPDVDMVICFGAHKQIERIGNSDQTQLVNTWIPKSAAVQRSGRTGRTRPGVCYRLYAQDLYNNFNDHEIPEVQRQPLDQLILRLRRMLDCPVLPMLRAMIEPPSVDAIDAAFASLFRLGMIEHPSDEGKLTVAGRFVAVMAISVRSGQLLANSYALGMMAEVIVVVASFQLQHSPYRMSVPLIHAPPEYNDIVSSTVMATAKHDGGMLSESMGILQLYKSWLASPNQVGWAVENSVAVLRIRQLDTMVHHLRTRVAKELSIPEEDLMIDPSAKLEEACQLYLRLLLTWTYQDQILRAERTKGPMSSPNSVLIEETNIISDREIKSVFREKQNKLKPHLEKVESNIFEVSRISVEQPVSSWRVDPFFRDIKIDFIAVLEEADVRSFTLFSRARYWATLSQAFNRQLSGACTLRRNLNVTDLAVGTTTIPSKRLYKDFKKHARHALTQPSILVIFSKHAAAEVVTCRCELHDGWKSLLLGKNSIWAKKHAAYSEFIVFNDVPVANPNLVQDCTGLGMKVLTSITNGYRGSPVLKVVSTAADRTTKVLELRVRTCRTSWTICPELNACRSNAKALLPRHSVLEGLGILNLAQHPVFAIAANLLFFSGGKEMARAEGVTVLPQGEEWILLALRCCGNDCTSWLGRGVDSERVRIAADIHMRLRTASINLDSSDTDLAVAIWELFSALPNATELELVDEESIVEQEAPVPIVHAPTVFNTEGHTMATLEESNDLNITDVLVLSRLRELSKIKAGGTKSYQDGGSKLKYACLRCGSKSTWKKCLAHMQLTTHCKKFVWDLIGDIEQEFVSKKPNALDDLSSLDPNSQRFSCFGKCGSQFASWTACLEHMRSEAVCFQNVISTQVKESRDGHWRIPIATRIGQAALRADENGDIFRCPSCAATMSWEDMKDHLEYSMACRDLVEDTYPTSPSGWTLPNFIVDGLFERCKINTA